MKLLFIGDTVGKGGRRAVARFLPELKAQEKPDLVIMNAENLAAGIATNEKTLLEMESCGVDFFTGGNHSFSYPEIFSRTNIIRPSNFRKGTPGKGSCTLSLGEESLTLINLLGNVFIHLPTTHVFDEMDRLLEDVPEKSAVFVDFHAEATSEKAAFFWRFVGRTSAIIGTHTHVPTADSRIVQGTFFQTDIGMTGPLDSVIGLDIASGIENFLSPTGKKKFQSSEGPAVFRAVLLNIFEGKTTSFQSFEFFEPL